MSTPIASPLMEEEVIPFLKRRVVAVFGDETGKRFAGRVGTIEYHANSHKTVERLIIRLNWVMEVQGYDLTPVPNKPIVTEVVKYLPSPYRIHQSCRGNEVLTCCVGENHDQKIKLSNKQSHVGAFQHLLELKKD